MTKQANKIIDPPFFPQLVLTFDIRRSISPDFLQKILQRKFFACVILYDSQFDNVFLQKQAQLYAQDIQNKDIALLISGENRIAERIKADGFHIEGDLNALEHLKSLKREQKIIGYGNIRDRHSAMLAGESGVNYLFFGKLGADKKPRPHPRNLQLAGWWSEIMEIPSVLQAGSDFATFDEVLKTASEFIAVEEIIFGNNNPLMLLEMMKEKCENSPTITRREHP
ncbi:thiamine phosphate synthase [Bartonella sp. B23]